MCHPVGFHFSSVWSCSAVTCQMILHWNNILGDKIIYFECSSRTINELILEDLNLRGYDTVLLGEWFLVLQRNVVPSSSRVKQSTENTCYLSWVTWSLKMKALSYFATSGTTCPVQCHILEDLNPQKHCCENRKSLINFSFFWKTKWKLVLHVSIVCGYSHYTH